MDARPWWPPPGRRQREVIDMDNLADTLDQADEDILNTPTVSDEAIEAAAGSEGGSIWTVPDPRWTCGQPQC